MNKIEEEMPDKNNKVDELLRKDELSQREIKRLNGEMEEMKKKIEASQFKPVNQSQSNDNQMSYRKVEWKKPNQ